MVTEASDFGSKSQNQHCKAFFNAFFYVSNSPAISGLFLETSLYSRFEALLKKCQIRNKIAFYNNTLVC